MAFKDLFKNMFVKENKQTQHAKLLDGSMPIFSQFGSDIYASDVVQICIDCIATECSKLQPKHIRTDVNGMQSNVRGSVNRLFKFAPNELMTTRDFIEKIIWLLYMNYNAYIYPTYDIITSNGAARREYTGFYPINPTQVTYLQDETNTLFVRFMFANGQEYTLPYSDVIHLRKKFSVNEIMGGGMNGQPDNSAILKVLEINDTVLQGLGKAIKSSLSIKGILKINTLLDDVGQKAERKKFEESLKSSESGILPMDLKGDYIDIKADPKLLDKDTLQFLQDKLLNYYGVSVPIFTGDFTDEQYQAFWEKTLNPIVIALGQAFSKTIFTSMELDIGNEIIFYQQDVNFLSTTSKTKLIEVMGAQGLLSDNQKLAMLGYPPIEGGERITQSLNYVDKAFINQYQLKRASGKGLEGQGNE